MDERSGTENDGGMTPGDPLGAAPAGESPADTPPTLPAAPFAGGIAAPFGAAAEDDALNPLLDASPNEPVAPEAISASEGPSASEPAPIRPTAHYAESASSSEALPKEMSQAPPSGFAAGDPLAAVPPLPAPSEPSPPRAPEAPGARPATSVAPPGYGGGPVPPGAFPPAAAAAAPGPALGLGHGPFQLSGWWKRVAATAIDGVIASVIIGGLLVIVGSLLGGIGSLAGDNAGGLAAAAGVVVAFLPVALLSVLVQPYWMHRTNGQTIGKQALGIRVVRTNGAPVTFGWAAGRQLGVIWLLFGFIGGWLFGLPTLLNYLWPLWDDENRALHDMIVSSRVIVG